MLAGYVVRCNLDKGGHPDDELLRWLQHELDQVDAELKVRGDNAEAVEHMGGGLDTGDELGVLERPEEPARLRRHRR